MAVFKPYMCGPYNECYKRNWLDPSLITHNEFATIFRNACQYHQGKGEHERYAAKVMKKFAKGSIAGSTITPLHQGLNNLMIPRIRARNGAIQAAQAEAARAAKQREDEIKNLMSSMTVVQNALNRNAEERGALQAQMNRCGERLSAAQSATELLAARVNELVQQIQNALSDGQHLQQQLTQLKQQLEQEAQALSAQEAGRVQRNALQARLLSEMEAKNANEARLITELRTILAKRNIQVPAIAEMPTIQVVRNGPPPRYVREMRENHARRDASYAGVIAQFKTRPNS